MLNILEIGMAMFIGSETFAGKENSRETSRSVALKCSFSPSEEIKTHDRMGRVDRVGTTLFKTFKASHKDSLLILKFIIKNIKNQTYKKTK